MFTVCFRASKWRVPVAVAALVTAALLGYSLAPSANCASEGYTLRAQPSPAPLAPGRSQEAAAIPAFPEALATSPAPVPEQPADAMAAASPPASAPPSPASSTPSLLPAALATPPAPPAPTVELPADALAASPPASAPPLPASSTPTLLLQDVLPICVNAACLLTDAEFITGDENVLFTSDAAADGASLSILNLLGARAFRVQHRNRSDHSRPYSVNARSDAGRQLLYIVKETYNLFNLGHVIGDEIFAHFHMLFDLGLASLPRSDVWIVVSGGMGMDQRGELTKSIVRQHYDLISSNPVLTTDGFASYYINEKPAYFQRLAVGWDRYGYAYEGTVTPTEAVVAAFRRRAMQLFALEDRAPPAAAPPACSVLFIVKDLASAVHAFVIANADELITALRERTNCTVEKVTWAGMPLPSQVAAIYDKRVVVSLMGADLMNCIFQPLRSGIIVLDFCVSEDLCVMSREVELWFAHFPSRIVNHVPGRGAGVTWNGGAATWDVDAFVETVLRMNNSI